MRSPGDRPELDRLLATLRDQPHSVLADHEARCCALGRRWLMAMDASLSPPARVWTAPTWLREKYEWGPMRWPVFWCQVPEAPWLDCGAFAALAGAIFLARSLAARPVQLVQRFSEQDARHWQSRWRRARVPADWIAETLVYHEAVAIVDGDAVRVWDPMDGAWLASGDQGSYGGTCAARVVAVGAEAAKPGHTLRWDGRRLVPGAWTVLD